MRAGKVATWAVPAALLGGAACVSCTLTLAFAIAGAIGLSATVPAGLPVWALVGLPVTLVAGAALAFRRVRREEAACATSPARSPYLVFSPRNAVLGTALAVGTVVGTALVAKTVVEGLGIAEYVIHWTTTVPALVAAFAWIFHGELNRSRSPASAPG